MEIKLNNKNYSLKFGLGFFRELGRVYGDTTLNQTLARLSVLDGVKEDIPFDFMDLIENLVVAAASYAGNPIEDKSEVIDLMFKDTSILQQIIAEIVESMPKLQDNQGKQKAQQKKSAKI